MDEIIFYFIEHWQGKLSINKAGWFSSVVALLLVVPTNLLELHSFLFLNHMGSLSDLVMGAENGALQSLTLPSFSIQALNEAVEFLVFVWWSVGAWRSCNNPDNMKSKHDYFISFRLTIILTAAFEFYDLFDFIQASIHGAMGTQ